MFGDDKYSNGIWGGGSKGRLENDWGDKFLLSAYALAYRTLEKIKKSLPDCQTYVAAGTRILTQEDYSRYCAIIARAGIYI